MKQGSTVKTNVSDFAGYIGTIERVEQAKSSKRLWYWVNFPDHPWAWLGPFSFDGWELEGDNQNAAANNDTAGMVETTRRT